MRILRFKFVARRAYSPCTHPAFHHLRACFSHICISRIFLRFLHVGLEAAISTMIANGIDETSSEVTSLKDSLAKAKRNAQEPSASIQLKGAKEFVERVRKRFAAHDAQHAVLEKELVDGETRVQRLAQVHRVGCRGLSVEGKSCNDGGGTTTFEGGSSKGVPCRADDRRSSQRAGIPPLPHHAEEVEQWLIDRNCELRSALHCQDTSMIAHILSTHRQGCQQVFHCRIRGRTVAVISHFRCRGGVSKPVSALLWWKTMCREKFEVWTSRSANRGGFAPRTDIASQISRIQERCCGYLFG